VRRAGELIRARSIPGTPPALTHADGDACSAHQIKASDPRVGVVVLSQYADESYAFELFRNGTAGLAYLLKDLVGDLRQLLSALHQVSAGGSVIDPMVVEALVARRARLRESPLAKLTTRELDVLREMAQGRGNAGIAARLTPLRRDGRLRGSCSAAAGDAGDHRCSPKVRPCSRCAALPSASPAVGVDMWSPSRRDDCLRLAGRGLLVRKIYPWVGVPAAAGAQSSDCDDDTATRSGPRPWTVPGDRPPANGVRVLDDVSLRVPRRGAGRWRRRRMVCTVVAETRTPSLRHWLRMRRYPQRGFSRASRSTRSTTSGSNPRCRPRAGQVHRGRISSRCRRSKFEGVTRTMGQRSWGSSLARAARIVRSAGV
jgi:hypothetical protein